VKTAGAAEGLPLMVKSIAASIDPKLFPHIRVLKADFHKNVQQVEQAAMVVSLLGMAALMLAAIGLLGLVAYAVSERTKEIAIRIAFGATPSHVLAPILRQVVWPVAFGLLAGEPPRCRSSFAGYCSASATSIRPVTWVESHF
jgi:ABC-type antimicrobial peptide transport system permease subunit